MVFLLIEYRWPVLFSVFRMGPSKYSARSSDKPWDCCIDSEKAPKRGSSMNSVSDSAEVEMLPILLDETPDDENVSNIPEPVHAVKSIQD